MNTLEKLLSTRWVTFEKDQELFQQIRSESSGYEEFLKDKLGYSILFYGDFLKLDKFGVPAKAWMGITEFNSKMSYVFLCLILQFLEGLDDEEQFILSEVAEFIQMEFKEEEITWLKRTQRFQLVEALRFCQKEGLVKQNDGSIEDYTYDQETQVLYENTGLSKYFMRSFSKNIAELNTIEEFEELNYPKDITDNEAFLRHRAYRKLLMTLAVFNSPEDEEEFKYIRRHRESIQENFSKYFDLTLHVHKNSAYLILGETSNFGRILPESLLTMETSLILLINSYLRRELAEKRAELDFQGNLLITKEDFKKVVLEARKLTNIAYTKVFREYKDDKFVEATLNSYKNIDMVKEEEDRYIFSPIVGKIIGEYNNDFFKVGMDDE